MNTDLPDLPAPSAALPEPGPLPEPPSHQASIASLKRNRIAHLPPDLLEAVHRLLHQGCTYNQIRAHLGHHATAITRSALSRFKKSAPHRDWLHDQRRRDTARAQLQVMLDLARQTEHGFLHDAVLQSASLRIGLALASLDPESLKQAFEQEPKSLVPILQTLAQIAQIGVACERARAEIAGLNRPPDKPVQFGLSPELRKELERTLDLM